MKNTEKTGQAPAEIAIDDCLRVLGADDVSECRKAILAALAAAGFALAPKEPTEAMLAHGVGELIDAGMDGPDGVGHYEVTAAYRAMLLAASETGE